MQMTLIIPDGYNGPIKQLACRICKHIFYLTLADYQRLDGVSYCHECSLILIEELEQSHETSDKRPLMQKSAPPLLPLPRL